MVNVKEMVNRIVKLFVKDVIVVPTKAVAITCTLIFRGFAVR